MTTANNIAAAILKTHGPNNTSAYDVKATLTRVTDEEVFVHIYGVVAESILCKASFLSIPDLVAFVGDTENDILPANEIGVRSIAVTTGIRSEEKLRIYNPSVIINSISDICNYID